MTARIDQVVDRKNDLATVTVTGSVDVEQVNRQILGFLGDKPTHRVLWDVRNGSLEKLTAEDMRRIIAEGAPHAAKRCGGRTAILCSKPVDFGLARMFETFASLYHLPFEIHVFTESAEAMEWLFAK